MQSSAGCYRLLARHTCVPASRLGNRRSSALVAHGHPRIRAPRLCIVDATCGISKAAGVLGSQAKWSKQSSARIAAGTSRLAIPSHAIQCFLFEDAATPKKLHLSRSTLNSKTTADRICKTSDKQSVLSRRHTFYNAICSQRAEQLLGPLAFSLDPETLEGPKSRHHLLQILTLIPA